MTLLKDPVVSSGDDLDNLLRAFFQAEMPNPWPAVEVPARRVFLAPPREELPAPSGRGSLSRSRLTLAASIALLVSGALFLAGTLRETGTNSSIPRSIDDSARKPRYRSHESLPVTPAGVSSIRIDIFEEPAKK